MSSRLPRPQVEQHQQDAHGPPRSSAARGGSQLSASDDDALSEGTTVSATAAGRAGPSRVKTAAGKKRPKTALKTSNLGRTPLRRRRRPRGHRRGDGAVARDGSRGGAVSEKQGTEARLGAPVAKRSTIRDGQDGRQTSNSDNDTSSSGSGYGNGGGLDLLAMLYSAAVTYETSVVAAARG